MRETRKVLIVDDSRYMREYLEDLFSSDDRFELLQSAADPYEAVKIISKEAPDAIALDIELPRMSGLTFLRKIMSQHPIPVVIVTNQDVGQIEMSLEALNAGAIDVVSKKDIGIGETEGRRDLLEKMWAAANSSVSRIYPRSPGAKLQKTEPIAIQPPAERIVMIGASSGGTGIISAILQNLALDIPGMIIVQHIPEHMSFLFARQLNAHTPFYVKEAENGDRVTKNKVLVTPGNHHIELNKDQTGYYIRLTQGPPINHVRPSVDKLFYSAMRYEAKNMYAILLTGMGQDGAQGLLKLRENGAYTIAQDERSSIIFGMPRVAIEMGAACAIMNPQEIIRFIKSIG